MYVRGKILPRRELAEDLALLRPGLARERGIGVGADAVHHLAGPLEELGRQRVPDMDGSAGHGESCMRIMKSDNGLRTDRKHQSIRLSWAPSGADHTVRGLACRDVRDGQSFGHTRIRSEHVRFFLVFPPGVARMSRGDWSHLTGGLKPG